MLRKVIFLLSSALLASNAAAQCTLARGAFTTLTLPAETITISADAVADTTNPIANGVFTTSTLSNIGYDECPAGTPIGRSLVGLSETVATRLYKTNVEGIGVKVHYRSATAKGFSFYPNQSTVGFENNEPIGTWDWSTGSYYRLQFFKTSDTLSLSDSSDNVVLNAGPLAYEWIMSEATRPVTLNINQIKIISTPACTVDSSKTIDFSTVTHAMLKSGGIEKPLDFGLTCKTDYGTYSAQASISSSTSSTDSKYIRVTDASGNSDNQLGIEIYNSSGSLMILNGTTLEKSDTVASGVAAQFNWIAKLVNTGSGKTRPQHGKFTASAEILLQLN